NNSSAAGNALYTGPFGFFYRSPDRGKTWSVLGQDTFKNQLFLQIVPTKLSTDGTASTEVVFATTRSNGIWWSPDGGNNWVQVLPGNTDYLAVDPGNSNRLFAAVPGQGIYESDKGGQKNTWQPINLNLSTLDAGFLNATTSSYIEL